MADIQRSDAPDAGAATAPAPESTIPTISEFKGKPTILLNPGSQWPFSLGLGKARIVLANVGFIQRFVDSNGTAVE